MASSRLRKRNAFIAVLLSLMPDLLLAISLVIDDPPFPSTLADLTWAFGIGGLFMGWGWGYLYLGRTLRAAAAFLTGYGVTFSAIALLLGMKLADSGRITEAQQDSLAAFVIPAVGVVFAVSGAVMAVDSVRLATADNRRARQR